MPEPAELERRTTELLQRLIRFNTVNPPGNEQAAQEYLKELLEGAGFECELLSSVPGRANLVARLGGGSDGPTLGLLGHVDTVLATPSEWTVDPWSGELRDGCVWGRGALDMKSQVAAEVAAAVALAEEGWRPESGELHMLVNEGGGDVLEFDGRRLYHVCVAEKGVFRFTISTRGRAGHASIPRIGDNALVKLAPILTRLAAAAVAPEPTVEPLAYLESLGVNLNGDLHAALAAVDQKDPRLAVLLEPMLGVTFTPTMASASHKINVIPSHAEIKVDCRVPPELGEDYVRARIEETLDGEDYELHFDERVTGNRSPIDTPLMDHIRHFIAAEDPGALPVPSVLPGFTDSRWFRAAFPDCVAYGFCPQNKRDIFEASPLIHGADERIPVEDLGLAARFYAGLATKVLG